MEIWKNIKGLESKYQVSNYGNIRSIDNIVKFGNGHRLVKGKILKYNLHRNGYGLVSVDKKRTVHRIVAETFIPNPNNYPQINHIDGNKLNNHVDNLEWCTSKYNNCHKYNVLGYKKTSIKYKRCTFSIEDVINDIKNRNADKVICNKYNISRGTLYLIKKENELQRYCHKILTNEEKQYVKDMINKNIHSDIISAYFLISHSAIYYIKKSMQN